eukprot:2541394-Rhodomonas_salina.4
MQILVLYRVSCQHISRRYAEVLPTSLCSRFHMPGTDYACGMRCPVLTYVRYQVVVPGVE